MATLKWPIPLADFAVSANFFVGIGHVLVHYLNNIKEIGKRIKESARECQNRYFWQSRQYFSNQNI